MCGGRLAILALASCAVVSFADLPVHCLRNEVVGEWTFTLLKANSSRSACGHRRPDKEEVQPSRSMFDNLKDSSYLRVQLSDPNLAKVQGQAGTWTMVYDEGFEVVAGDRVFFAFSNFTFEKDESSLGKHNVSHCGDTMVGWYSNKERTEFGCYYGNKQQPSKSLAATSTRDTKELPTGSKGKGATTSTFDTPLDRKTQETKVAKLNKKLAFLQRSWTARVMPQWNGKTLREINSYAGLMRQVPVHDMHRDMMVQQRRQLPAKRQSFLQRSSMEKSPVPDTWSWTDVNGRDYTEPVMDQGDCGSCYDASTMRMLTARHKIRLNKTDAIPWSINFPLFCSEYNQGCKGGYGFLTTKWSEEVGLIPATCMRYDTQGSCKLECDIKKELHGQKRYRAANHRYINSWYGNFSTNDEGIKEEIYRNGPVVLSFEPSEDFMFYSGGIFKSVSAPSKLRKHIDYDQQWERVDHAVVAVGYGEENGQKYWLIQNSWGPDWGEDGFFRMARGVDESGIEGIPEAADVVEDEQNGRQVDAMFAQEQ
jgi:cathepsin C